MPSWFVPPIVIPVGLAALIAACAIYHAYAVASIPTPAVVVGIAETSIHV